VKSFNFVTK